MPKCYRTACATELTVGKACYRIWNDFSVRVPNHYCVPCGRRIMDANAQHDGVKFVATIEKSFDSPLPESDPRDTPVPKGWDHV